MCSDAGITAGVTLRLQVGAEQTKKPNVVQFLEFDEELGQFAITPDAMSCLNQHQSSKIVVVSIIGAIGSGKSTLANILTEAATGQKPFEVSSQPMESEQSCTLTVNMYGPMGLDGDTQLVVLDCCGIGLRSFDVEARLLSFLCLISSRIILN